MKNLLIFSFVGAMALAGAVGYLLLKPTPEVIDKDSSPQVNTSVTATPIPEPISGQGSLSELMAKAVNLECQISYLPENETLPVEGTYFTSAGMMRGDFVIPGLGENDVSSIILRDDTLYSWSEVNGETYGMKVDLATMASVKADETAPATNEPVPLDSPVDYNCQAWSEVDTSIFIVPADVLFRDYADLIGGGMEYGTSYGEPGVPATSPCELCLQVPAGEGRDECQARFQCQ